MVKKIENLPGNILGFEAIGEITANDYESVIFPAVEKVRKEGNEIRFLYHIGDKFEKIDFMAAVDDAILGLKHFTHWQKVAVVSDNAFVTTSVKALGLLLPGQVKTYTNKEFDEAVSWLKQ